MALRTFLGGGHTAKRVYSVTIPELAAGQGLRLRFRAAAGSYVEHLSAGGVGSGAAAVTALAAAWNASTDPRLAEATAAADTEDAATLLITADVAGRDFGPLEIANYGSVPDGWQTSLNARQMITFPAGVTGGTYVVRYAGRATDTLELLAGPGALAAGLEALDAIGAGNVVVTELSATTWQVEFAGALAGTDMGMLGVRSELVGPGLVDVLRTVAGHEPECEIQILAVSVDAAGGTYQILFGGMSSGAIAYDANAAVIQAALEAMPTIGVGTTVSGAGPFEVIYGGICANRNMAALSASPHLLQLESVAVDILEAGSVPVDARWHVIMPTPATGGTWVLGWDGSTSGTLDFGAAAATVEAALEAMPSIGAGVVVTAVADGYSIQFGGDTAGMVMDPDEATVIHELVGEVDIQVAHTRPGIGGSNEQQSYAIPAAVNAGTYAFVLSGVTSTGVAWDASDAEIEAALEGMANIGAGNVEVTADGTTRTVEFLGALAHVNVALMTANSTLTRPVTITPATLVEGVEGTDEVQRITLPAEVAGGLTGTWTATFGGETTAALAHNANAAQVEAALEALSSIGAGNIAVTGDGYPFSCTFVEDLASTNVATMTSSGYWLGADVIEPDTTTPGQAPTYEVQHVVVSGATGGTWYLRFHGSEQSGGLAWDENTAATVKAILENLSTITTVNVTGSAAAGWDITLVETNVSGDQPLMTAESQLTGYAGQVYTATLVPGDPNEGQPQQEDIDWSEATDSFYLWWNSEQIGPFSTTESPATVGEACKTFPLQDDGSYEVIGTYAIRWSFGPPYGEGDLITATNEGVTTVEYQEGIPGGDPVDEKQHIGFTNAEWGTYTLTFDGYTTAGLAYNANAAQVEAALEGLTSIGAGNIDVAAVGDGFDATFAGDLAGQDVAQIAAAGYMIQTPTITITEEIPGAAGQSEIQTLAFNTVPIAGTWTATFDGHTTTALAFNAAALDVEAALVALPSVGADNMTVGGEITTGGFVVNFIGDLADADQPEITVDDSALVVGPDPAVTVFQPGVPGTNAVQTLIADLSPNGGTWTITHDGETTEPLAYNATAEEVEAALQLLSTIEENGAAVIGDSLLAGLTVEFCGPQSSRPQNDVVVTSAVTSDYEITITTSQQGGEGGISEIQTIDFPAEVSAGYWTATLDGHTSPDIPWGANAAVIQGILEQTSSIGAGNVDVECPTDHQVVCTFVSDLRGVDVATLAITNKLGGPDLATVTEITAGVWGADQVQRLSVLNGSRGFWQLGKIAGGLTTWGASELPYHAAALQLQEAIRELGIGAGVSVSKITDDAALKVYEIRCLGAAGKQPQPTLLGRPYAGHPDPLRNVASGRIRRLAGGHPTQSEIQRVVATGGGGTFQLVFAGDPSAGIPFTANALQLQSELEAIPTIGAGNVLVSLTTSSDWLVNFQGALADTAVATLSPVSHLTPVPITLTTDVSQEAETPRDARLWIDFTAGWGYNSLLHINIDGAYYPNPDPPINNSYPSGIYLHHGQTAGEIQAFFDGDPDCVGGVTVTGGPVGIARVFFAFGDQLGAKRLYGEGLETWRLSVLNYNQGYTGIQATGADDEGADPANEIQRVIFDTAPTAGTYTITYGGSTATLAWDLNAAQVEAALAALPTIGVGNISVTGGPSSTSRSFKLEFGGIYAQQDVAAIAVASYLPSATEATVTTSKTQTGGTAANEVQEFTLVGALAGGTMTLYADGDPNKPVPLAYDADAADIRIGLETWYGEDNVEVDGTNPWTIEWVGEEAATPIATLGFSHALTTAPASVVPQIVVPGQLGTDAVQQVAFTTLPIAGTFRLAYGQAETGDIAHDATADTVAAYLGALEGIGPEGASVTNATGGGFLISFDGAATKSRPHNLLVADGTALTVAAYAPTVTETTKGQAAANDRQTLVFGTNAANGTWTVSHDGHTTVALAWDASAAAVEAALEDQLGASTVEASGGPAPLPILLEFTGTYGQSLQPEVTVASDLHGPVIEAIEIDSAVDGFAGTDARQTLTPPADVQSGTCTITIAATETGAIDWDATAADVQAALVAAFGAGPTATGGPWPGAPITITLSGAALGTQPQEAIDVTSALLGPLEGGVTISTTVEGSPAIDERQTLVAPDGAQAGVFQVAFGGETTEPLAYNATAEEVQTALEALSSVGAGNLVATLGPLGTRPIALRFAGTLAAAPQDLVETVGAVQVAYADVAVAETQDGYSGSSLRVLTRADNAGPGVWDQEDNWADAAVAGEADDINVKAANIYYNLPDGSLRYGTVSHYGLRGGRLGLPELNTFSTGASYPEYRPRFAVIPADRIEIGLGDGPGSDFIALDIGDGISTTVVVRGMAAPTGYEPALQIRGGDAESTVLYVQRGQVGLTDAHFKTFEVANANGSYGDAKVTAAPGCTLVDVLSNGGELRLYCGWSTLVLYEGYVYQYEGVTGAGDLAGGVFYHMSADSGTSFVVGAKGNLDFDRDVRSVSIPLITVKAGGKISGHYKRVVGELQDESAQGDPTTLRKPRAFITP